FPAMSTAYAAQSNLPTILGVLTTFFFLAIVVVGLRVYSRLRIARAAGIDDILIVIAALGQWIVILIQAHHGLGRHQSTLSEEELTIFNHASFWGNVIGIAIGTMFLKLSIAVNLLRVCQNRSFTVVLWILIAIIILYEMLGTLFFFFNCRPMAGSWDFTIDAKCASTSVIVIFGLINTSFNIFTDVALAILPIPIIWRLNMKRSVRMYLVGVLSLGYLAVAMDIVKTYYQETYTATTDETYTFSLIFYGFLEDCVGMIAASVPMFRPLVGKALGLGSSDTYYPYG
ncbi:integral membrane protein, partial [Aspergillus sclerotiicarbonarius CBS 121057]